MLKVSREFKTGLVAVVVIALFIWGYNYMKGLNLFDGPLNTYFTKYNNVQGLNTASVVTINGVEVGKVVDIKFNTDPEKRGELIVEFSIENDFEFSKSSVAKIYSASLMGGKSLAIIPSYEGDMAQPGDFLKGEIESDIFSSVTEKLNPLQAKVESVIVSADSILVGINEIIDAKNKENLKQSVEDFSLAVANLKDISNSVKSMVDDNSQEINKSVENIGKLTSNLEKISDTLASANIAGTIREVEQTLQNLNLLIDGLEKGEGTMGKLMKDENMYINLTNASKELEELLREMKLHPKRFVHFSLFGKKDKGYVKEEE